MVESTVYTAADAVGVAAVRSTDKTTIVSLPATICCMCWSCGAVFESFVAVVVEAGSSLEFVKWTVDSEREHYWPLNMLIGTFQRKSLHDFQLGWVKRQNFWLPRHQLNRWLA